MTPSSYTRTHRPPVHTCTYKHAHARRGQPRASYTRFIFLGPSASSSQGIAGLPSSSVILATSAGAPTSRRPDAMAIFFRPVAPRIQYTVDSLIGTAIVVGTGWGRQWADIPAFGASASRPGRVYDVSGGREGRRRKKMEDRKRSGGPDLERTSCAANIAGVPPRYLHNNRSGVRFHRASFSSSARPR